MSNPSLSDFDLPFDRREFSEVARISGRMLNEMSHSRIMGAENLLTKAIRALRAGDDDRAGQLITRAAQMPYDPREEGSPGVRGATMLVYNAIAGRFEDSDDGDSTWLDVALSVHPDLDPTGQAEVASIVHGYVLQSPMFAVSPAEKRRIQQAFGDAPLEADLGDEPDSTVEQRHAILRSLVLAAMALDEAFAAVTGEPPAE